MSRKRIGWRQRPVSREGEPARPGRTETAKQRFRLRPPLVPMLTLVFRAPAPTAVACSARWTCTTFSPPAAAVPESSPDNVWGLIASLLSANVILIT